MKIKSHHYIVHHTSKGRGHGGRRLHGSKHRMRHFPLGNRDEALRSLEDLFGVSNTMPSADIAVY